VAVRLVMVFAVGCEKEILPDIELLSKFFENVIEIFVFRLTFVSLLVGLVLETSKAVTSVAAGNARTPNTNGSGLGVHDI